MENFKTRFSPNASERYRAAGMGNANLFQEIGEDFDMHPVDARKQRLQLKRICNLNVKDSKDRRHESISITPTNGSGKIKPELNISINVTLEPIHWHVCLSSLLDFLAGEGWTTLCPEHHCWSRQ